MKSEDLAGVHSSRPECRRLAYSLAAGAAAATTGATGADAAIVYSGLQDISIGSGYHQSIEVQTKYLPLSTIYGDILLKNYVFSGHPYQGLDIRYAPGRFVGFKSGNLYY